MKSIEQIELFLEPKSFATVPEATGLLDVDSSTITRWIRQKYLQADWIGSEYHISPRSLINLAQTRKRRGRKWMQYFQSEQLELAPAAETSAPKPCLSERDLRIARNARKLYSAGEQESAVVLAMSVINKMLD